MQNFQFYFFLFTGYLYLVNQTDYCQFVSLSLNKESISEDSKWLYERIIGLYLITIGFLSYAGYIGEFYLFYCHVLFLGISVFTGTHVFLIIHSCIVGIYLAELLNTQIMEEPKEEFSQESEDDDSSSTNDSSSINESGDSNIPKN